MGPSLSTHDTVGGAEANSKNNGEQNDDKLDDGISPQRFAIWVLLVQTPLQQKLAADHYQRKNELAISADWKIAEIATPTMKTTVVVQCAVPWVNALN